MELENEIYSYDSGVRARRENRNADSGLKPKAVKAAKGTAK
ncbi:MAG: hypothetical protein ACTSRF_15050 [Candidatus Freyarchaeota archaeon]